MESNGSDTDKDQAPQNLIEKWTQIFHFTDMDNDGIVTQKDYDITKERLVNNANLSPKKRDAVINVFYGMWVNQEAPTTEITLEKWLEDFTKRYRKGDMPKAVTTLRTLIFHCMDLNDDGLIDFKEFMIIANAVGRSEMPYMEDAFKAIDTDEDGFLCLEEYTNAYVKYACDSNVKMGNLPLYGLPKTCEKVDNSWTLE